MPPLSYIDTCYLLMFIDENDKLRRDFDLIGKDVTKKVSRTHPKLCVPMASLGEAIFKAFEKKGETGLLFTELNKLIASGFLTVRHLDSPDVFRLAISISEKQPDGRDSVSLMDAFILASAAVDSECSIFLHV